MWLFPLKLNETMKLKFQFSVLLAIFPPLALVLAMGNEVMEHCGMSRALVVRVNIFNPSRQVSVRLRLAWSSGATKGLSLKKQKQKQNKERKENLGSNIE